MKKYALDSPIAAGATMIAKPDNRAKQVLA